MRSVSILLRLSWRLAWRSGLGGRWRRIVVPICAGVAMVVALAGASVLNLAQTYADRERNSRSAVVASVMRDAHFAAIQSSVRVARQDIALTWIEPTTAGGLNRVPGLPRALEPGETAVSPALNRLLATQSSPGRLFARRVELTRSALRDPAELIAYVRPERGGSVADDPRSVRFSEPARAGEGGTLFYSLTSFRPGRDLYGALALFIAVPSLVLLWLAATASSQRRQRRIATLSWLGASPAVAATITAAETLALAWPGIAAGALAFAVVARELQAIPIVDHQVFAGDLTPPPPLVAFTIVALVIALTASSAAIGLRGALRPADGPRPRAHRPWRTRSRARLRIGALAAAAVSLVSSFTLSVGSSFAIPLFLIAGIVLIVSVPSLCTAAIASVGDRLARSGGAQSLLHGRLLARVGARDLRPYAAAAIVLTAVVALSGLYSRITNPIATPSATPQAALLRWSAPEPRDLTEIAERLPGVELYPVRQSDTSTRITGRCQAIAAMLPALRCDAQPGAQLAPILSVAPDAITFDEQPDKRSANAALVLSKVPDLDLPDHIYAAALDAGVPRPLVDYASWEPSDTDEFLRWMILAALSSGVPLLIALLFAQAELAATQRRESSVLIRLGMPTSRLRQMIATRHMLVAAVCNTVGLAAGLAIALAFTKSSDHRFPTPTAGLAMAVAGATAIILLGGILAWTAAINNPHTDTAASR